MKKLLLILTLLPIFITSSFSQNCDEQSLPAWDKEKYIYAGEYINSQELKDFFLNYKTYIKCKKERRKSIIFHF